MFEGLATAIHSSALCDNAVQKKSTYKGRYVIVNVSTLMAAEFKVKNETLAGAPCFLM